MTSTAAPVYHPPGYDELYSAGSITIMSMDEHVGAKMEAIAPTSITEFVDRKYLAILILFSAALHLFIAFQTKVTARDSLEFARIALQLKKPSAVDKQSFVEVLRDPELNKQHPGYPVSILIADTFAGIYYGDSTPIQHRIIRSAQAASFVAAVLLVFPSYWLGRTLFGKHAGFAAALLFQALPGVAHKTSDGLSEAFYMLWVATTLLCAVSAVKTPSIGRFLICGLSCGLAYLTRPEGLALGVATGVVAFGLMLVRQWKVGETFGRLTAMVIGFLIVGGPYMVVIGGLTKKPSGNDIVNQAMNSSPQPLLATKGPLLAAWYDESKDGPLYLWVVRAFFEESLKTFHYVPAIPALIGLLFAWRRFRTEPWLWVPIVFVAIMSVALLKHASTGHKTGDVTSYYLSERHTIPLVFVGCLFAGFGLGKIPDLFARIPGLTALARPALSVTLGAILVLGCLPKAIKPEHTQRIGHVQAGLFLAQELHDDDTLIDPYEWAQFYAGRTIYRVLPDPKDSKTIYAVVEMKPKPPKATRVGVPEDESIPDKDESPHSMLPRRQPALDVKKDGRAILVWRSEDGLVEVYKLDIGK